MNFEAHINTARKYLETHQAANKDSAITISVPVTSPNDNTKKEENEVPEPTTKSTTTTTPVISEGNTTKPAQVATPPKQLAEVTLLSDTHSWFEHKILLPRVDKKSSTVQLVPAIIYELSLDPRQRISVICSWVVTAPNESDGETEVSCRRTYSPQLLIQYNAKVLPELEVAMQPEEWERLPQQHALADTLYEVNLLRATLLSV